MDIKTVKNLVAILENSTLNRLEVEDETADGSFRLCIEKSSTAGQVIVRESSVVPPQAVSAPREQNAPQVDADAERVLDYNFVEEVTSPMVGIFYTAPSPDASPFVTKGQKVKKGDTLCIIEAMKLMNDVTADRDGEIVEVCAANGSLVEFGQVLFKIF